MIASNRPSVIVKTLSHLFRLIAIELSVNISQLIDFNIISPFIEICKITKYTLHYLRIARI